MNATLSANPAISLQELAVLGEGRIAYVKPMLSDEVSRAFPQAPKNSAGSSSLRPVRGGRLADLIAEFARGRSGECARQRSYDGRVCTERPGGRYPREGTLPRRREPPRRRRAAHRGRPARSDEDAASASSHRHQLSATAPAAPPSPRRSLDSPFASFARPGSGVSPPGREERSPTSPSRRSPSFPRRARRRLRGRARQGEHMGQNRQEEDHGLRIARVSDIPAKASLLPAAPCRPSSRGASAAGAFQSFQARIRR